MKRMMTKTVTKIAVVLVGSTVMLFAGMALDADEASAQQGVINLDETVIKGRIQKPEAFYILQHANLKYEKLTPKQSFLDELKKSVEQDPF